MKIALYHGKSLISRLIRWQTRSPYSHAAFLLDNGGVIEAWAPIVREINPLPPRNSLVEHHPSLPALSAQHTPGTRVDIFRFTTPLKRDENRMLEFLARRDVGTPYDYRGIFRFLTREPGGTKHRLFCSEMVFARCAQIGRPLLDRTEAWRVPPDWLARSPHLELEQTVVTA